MAYGNNLSDVTLKSDFQDVLEEARTYVNSNDDSKCVIHHVKDNTLEEIREGIKECRKKTVSKFLDRDLPNILDTLSAYVVISMFLGGKYSLTRVGKILEKETPDPYNK